MEDRDDLFLERIALYNSLGEYRKAFDLLMARKFHPWEGGEGKVTGQYQLALIGMARIKINEGGFEEAIALLDAARSFPGNLGERNRQHCLKLIRLGKEGKEMAG